MEGGHEGFFPRSVKILDILPKSVKILYISPIEGVMGDIPPMEGVMGGIPPDIGSFCCVGIVISVCGGCIEVIRW